MRHSINEWAPKCAITDCTNRVRYHTRWSRLDGTPAAKWKVFCEHHRNAGKPEADNWKLQQGCANKKFNHYNFECYTSKIVIPDQLDVNHISGDRRNNDSSNIEVLCKNCHVIVTKQQSHHKIRYINALELSPLLFEVVE
jgi:hypothetical protein